MADELQSPTALCIELTRGERVERFEVHGGRALIGSAAHCDVRIRPDDGAPEHLVFELRGAAIMARALASTPPCRIDGALLIEQRAAENARIALGELSLRVSRAAPGLDTGKRNEYALLPPQLQAVALIGLAIAFYHVLRPPPEQSLLGTAVQMPALFGPQRASCPAADASAAGALALQLQQAAEGKRERSPFRAGEGVAAVALYRQAAACLERAGDAAAAHDVGEVATALARQLSDELRVRQVRLERFLALARYDAAQREIHVLRSFMGERSDPYTQWLAAVQREIDTRFASARRRGS